MSYLFFAASVLVLLEASDVPAAEHRHSRLSLRAYRLLISGSFGLQLALYTAFSD